MWTKIGIGIFDIIHTFLSIFGCFLNAFLIYLALYRTPCVIKQYTTLVINFAVTDFLACFTEFWVQQRIIPTGRTLAFISNGACSHFGPTFCFTLYSLMLHFFSHSLWSLLLSFSYRYYILFRPPPLRKTLVFIVTLIYIPSLFQAIIFLFAYDDPLIIKSKLMEKYPNYDLEGKMITGTMDTFRFAAMFPTLHMVLPITPVYIAILILRRKIIGTLACMGSTMAEHTKNMHSQLLKALTYQAALPFFYWFGIGSFVLGQVNIIHHPVVESCALYLLFIPVLSPVASFIFVRPYRNFILKLFRRKGARYNETKPSIAMTGTYSSHTWQS